MKKLSCALMLVFALVVGMSGVASAKSDHSNSGKHHGANRDGAYTAQDPPVEQKSTRDSNESSDHDEDGEPGNRPSDGSVGKADDKNPPGQHPDGSDHNKGYECDKNHGVGTGNPAHSGCAPTTTVKHHETTTTTEHRVTTTTEGPKVRHHTKTKLIPPVVVERPAPTTTIVRPIPVTKAVPTAPALAVTGNGDYSPWVTLAVFLLLAGAVIVWVTRYKK